MPGVTAARASTPPPGEVVQPAATVFCFGIWHPERGSPDHDDGTCRPEGLRSAAVYDDPGAPPRNRGDVPDLRPVLSARRQREVVPGQHLTEHGHAFHQREARADTPTHPTTEGDPG